MYIIYIYICNYLIDYSCKAQAFKECKLKLETEDASSLQWVLAAIASSRANVKRVRPTSSRAASEIGPRMCL